MFSLLIVDDDEVICEGIATCFNWKSLDITKVDTAHNGRQALELIRTKPYDIVITDIEMPFMNGLELAEAILGEFPTTKLILLSAYKEFSYAQKAIDLKLFQYLTKPFTESDILSCVTNVEKIIIEERKKTKEVSKSISDYIEKDFVQFITSGSTETSVKYIFDFLDITLDNCYYAVALLSIKPKGFLTEIEKAKSNNVRLNSLNPTFVNELSEIREDKYCRIFLKFGSDIIIFSYSKLGSLYCTENLRNFCTEIHYVLKKSDNFLYHFGIGHVVTEKSQINISFLKAKDALYNIDNYESGSIIEYTSNYDYKSISSATINSSVIKTKLIDYIQQNNIVQALEFFNYTFVTLHHNSKITLSKVRLIFMDILLYTYRYFIDGSQYSQLISLSDTMFEDLLTASSLEHLLELTKHKIQLLFYTLNENKDNQGSKIYKDIKEYIKNNYNNPDLCIGTITDKIHISPSYLCYLFKKYDNNSFINYLTSIRIEASKVMLLNSNIKITELSSKVGYNSSQYFNSCFKKHTGFTPNEYRLKLNI